MISARYLTELVRLRCAPDLLDPRFRLFPNAKEVTESFGAFNACRNHFRDWMQDRETPVEVYCVGDGCRPRTGAVFALRTRWNVTSVDPALKSPRATASVPRLFCEARRVEELDGAHSRRCLIVAVHSHAPMDAVLERFTADEMGAIVIPCCVDQSCSIASLGLARLKPKAVYPDMGIHSPMRTVSVWRWGKSETESAS